MKNYVITWKVRHSHRKFNLKNESKLLIVKVNRLSIDIALRQSQRLNHMSASDLVR